MGELRSLKRAKDEVTLTISDIGQSLRVFRARAGLTQHDLYARANGGGDGQSYISRVERGEGNVTLDTFLELCFHLKTSPIDVLTVAKEIANDKVVPEEVAILKCLENDALGLSSDTLAEVRRKVSQIQSLRRRSANGAGETAKRKRRTAKTK